MNLNEVPSYRSFVNQRDQALQVFHNKTQQIISDLLRGVFSNVLLNIQAYYTKLVGDSATPLINQVIADLDRNVDGQFKAVIPQITSLVMRMRQNSYIMANAGEVEAIGRALGSDQTADVGQQQVKEEEERPSSAGGQLPQRVELYFDRLRRKLMDAIQLGAISQDNQTDFMDRVYKILPQQRRYARPPKALKDVKESNRFREQISFGRGRGRGTPVGGVSMTTGFIDESLWEGMVQDYIEEYVPVNRGPEAVVDVKAIPKATKTIAGSIPPASKDQWYLWELERDITQEFVDSVRKGQIDAANKNGITDFVWIAIVDSKTDECCLWRDGLTTKEIARRLKTDKSGDPCKAITPPAHFNCRCTLAGATDKIPDKPDVDLGDFEQWLVNPEA